MVALRSLQHEAAWMGECEVVRDERDRERQTRRDEEDDARLREPHYGSDIEGDVE